MTQEQLFISQQSSSDMGRKGEQFVLEYERHRLPSFLHDKIVHLGQYEVARGYDILSCETKDSILPDRYIEVKTYKGHPHFYWTDNEIAAARKYGSHYYLYLIDIDRVGESNYEPTIIPNPAVLFNENSQWTFQVQQYAFTLVSNEQIPSDWDTSTILIGCYNNEDHLKWILSNGKYNVRSQKDAPGAVTLSNPLVRQTTYLILYSVANPRVFILYSLEPQPYKVTKTEMLALGYPNPHAFSYILHPIKARLDSFHIDLTTLLREVNHQGDNKYGQPLYLNGQQLRRFMAKEDQGSVCETPNATASKSGQPWTLSQEQKLRDLFNSRVSFEEIAIQMQRSRKAILSRLDKLGLINKNQKKKS